MLQDSPIATGQILDGSPVPTFVIDSRHVVVHWNAALARLSGIPAQEVLGTHHQWRAFYPAHRPVLADLVVDAAPRNLLDKFYRGKFHSSPLADGGWEVEDFFPSLGEKGRWLAFCASPIRDAEGAIVGCIETLQDITERKTMEIARRDAERRLTEIVNSSPVPTFVIDTDSRVTHWNRACEALTGVAAHEIIGRDEVWRAFYPYDTRRVVLADLVVKGTSLEALAAHYGERAQLSALVPGAFEAKDFFPGFGEQGKTMRFMAAPLRNTKGEITGAIETLIDAGGPQATPGF